ncbi:MAG TPA: aspartate kinase [Prosthecobacter sp.]|jgi:aspartate kinase|nr:aspartate kinase [Prosthecobacter sp.]
MAIVVQKYGGSSVADADKIRAVARRVIRTRDLGHQVVVVVSAMGDTTDDLLQTAKKVSANPERRELDMLLSVGERISMSLLSMAIRDLGGDAISFTGSQAGIITNDRHVDARIIEVRPFRVQDELALGKIVIIAGYQGVSYRKEVTTLGRGGSDTTAVAMAAALDAEWCEICSDVDGVYSADPRVVPQAQRIATMSYEEMQEMAEAGAKVLNAQAVEFAKERGISIYARATAQPPPEGDSLSDGTVVRKFGPRMPGTVVGVASEKDLFVLQATADADALLAFLDSRQVCGKQLHLASAGGPSDGLSMVLSRENLHDEERVRNLLAEKFGGSVRLLDGIGAVSVIGTGINTSYKNLRAGSAALAALDVLGISTSSFRITWLMPQSAVEEAVRRLHQTFLEAGRPPVP